MAQDSHFTGGKAKPAAPSFKENISGPVTKHHRIALGNIDVTENPQGVGAVSKRPTVSNGQGKNY